MFTYGFKHGIKHSFAYMNNEPIDNFVKNAFFSSWEEDTFNIFDQVKDINGIAIDIGAWIGTTSMWLSHNFKNVIAIEADKESLKYLKLNLLESKCNNVFIYEQPIGKSNKKVYFGPRGSLLNESMSHIKNSKTNIHDIEIDSITFNDLKIPENSYIKFIKCDIEGGEEDIVEELLNFSIKNNSQVWLSFHLDWWTDKNLQRFENIFKNFNTNVSNPIDYIYKNPFGSILFTPINCS